MIAAPATTSTSVSTPRRNNRMRPECYTGGLENSQTSRRLILAIDGPSGVGKGTVSRALAEALGYRHIDTGAMYRAVAWTARAQGVPLDNEAAVADLAARVELSMAGGGVIVNGVDVTRAIRTPEMDQAAAVVRFGRRGRRRSWCRGWGGRAV